MSIILNADSYKFSHWLGYPPGTQRVYSYVEARKPLYGIGDLKESVFFGLQPYLIDYLSKPITREEIDEAEDVITKHGLPFNRTGWEHILDKHGGYLPVEIKAVPEGTVMPVGNVQVTVENTDPEAYWLTGFIETSMLRAIWYPSTVATVSRECKRIIYDYLKESSDDPDGQILFKLHDFGDRGVSSAESAKIGGLAHLVNFLGTDTVEALVAGREYYDCDMAGFSIPAAEHSTMTSWGGREGELKAMENMLDQFAKPGRLLAVVSDSYDIWNAVENLWGGVLKERVEQSGATVVVRPDSGDPTTVPVAVINKLMDRYGYEVNSKGFKVLPSCIRVIQGDGITYHSIKTILDNMRRNGLSGDNLTFGMGGGLLQMVNRDTLGYAMKCSAIRVNGVWRDVFKDPVTDRGKVSKRGKFVLVRNGDGGFQTAALTWGAGNDLLEPVFRNGDILRRQTLDEIRKNAKL